MKRYCKCCGKPFETIYIAAKYCGESCRVDSQRREKMERQRERRKMEKAEKEKTKSATIVSIDAEARKAGMSYGQYVAKMGI